MGRLLLMVLGAFVGACGSSDDGRSSDEAAPAALAVITLPELSRVDKPVESQIRERYAGVTKLLASADTPPRELGTAFGEYGMLLHAAEYLDAAEPAYRNAQMLLPDNPRWPYYLAHLYRTQGKTGQAIEAFRQTLRLRPDEAAALVWLGRMYLDQGNPSEAESLFTRAQSVAPALIAAQAGVGQAALAKKEYARAAQTLESALASDPSATSLYAPLATAYRGLGQTEKAESLAKYWRNTELAVPDPLRAELDMAVQSGLSYELRGVRALDAGDYQGAAGLFRQGLALAGPGSSLSRSLRHKLGTALALSGDAAGAAREFRETVNQAPPTGLDEPAAKASYSLGVLMASQGRTADAIQSLTAALRYNPNYLEARMALADVLRGGGRVEASLQHYGEAIRLNPRAADARLSYALGLVRLGRYADARASLEESVRAQPDRPELAHALARLLASAPDPAVRDGKRALAMSQELAKSSPNTEVGETMAMALAEVGAYSDAVAVQRDVMETARKAGLDADVQRMSATLRLYESGRPSRTPWPADHPIHTSPIR
jgi:tetratricopeptide (TPR) repeat protein